MSYPAENILKILDALSKESRPMPSDLDTYRRVVDYLKSEVDLGRLRIIVYPQGYGTFVFYLQEIEPHEADSMGNLVALGIPIQRVNEIINGEVFVSLHYVYWGKLDEFLRWGEPSGQTEDILKEKFEITRRLLSRNLEERILLVRSLTSSSLIYATHDVHSREVYGRGGEVETLSSALVKLVIRDHVSAQPAGSDTSIWFELTLGEVRDLIHDLEIIAKKLEAKRSQG